LIAPGAGTVQTLKPGQSPQSHEAGEAWGVVVELSLGPRLFERELKVHGVFLASGPTNTASTFSRSLSWLRLVIEAHSGTSQLVQSKLGEFERLEIASITSGHILEFICHQGRTKALGKA
jgi:hypothetical protein